MVKTDDSVSREIGLQRDGSDAGDLTGVDLELQADELLADEPFTSDGVRLLTERQLMRKMRRDSLRFAHSEPDGLPDEVVEYLIDGHMRSALENCDLTKLQRRIYELSARGASCSEIAAATGAARQRIATALLQVERKVAGREDKYAGLQEVYWSEVRRHVYRKPRHRRG